MKVQKINNNKAMIILTDEELKGRKITLKDIKEGKSKAQDFFFELLEEADIIQDMDAESSQLLIEVSIMENNLFAITITKADAVDDLSKIISTKNPKRFSYSVSSNLYEFNSLNDLYKFCMKVIDENLFIGNNSLYFLNNKYFLFFDNSTIRKAAFVKTFSILSEYAEKYYSKNLLVFLEHSDLVIEKVAIQKLQQI